MTSATNAGRRGGRQHDDEQVHLPGSEARSGTQRTPSISSTPGLTTVIDAGSKPSRRMLRRITRPGFIR